MYRAALSAAVVLLTLVASTRADVIVLQNGSRIEGQILGGTANEIRIRRATGTGGGTFVDVIDREDILRIDRNKPVRVPQPDPSGLESLSEPVPASAPAASVHTGRADSAAQPPVKLDAQTQRALAMAVASWRAEEFAGAGREFSRLIRSVSAGQREAMSALVTASTGLTLAEIAADAHFRAAMAKRRGGGVAFQYVTDYEKPVLIPRIMAAFKTAIREKEAVVPAALTETRGSDMPGSPVAPGPDKSRPRPSRSPGSARGGSDRSGAAAGAGHPAASQPWYAAARYPQSQPASAPASTREPGYAVIDWLDRPEQFDGSVAQARALLARVALAQSLLTERLQLDRGLKKQPDVQRQILQERQRLAVLSKVLSRWISRGPPDRLAEKEAAFEQSRQEYYEQRQKADQQEEMERNRQIQESARKWQAEQEKARKPGLFDWLRPTDRTGKSSPLPQPPAQPQPSVQPQPPVAPAPQPAPAPPAQ